MRTGGGSFDYADSSGFHAIAGLEVWGLMIAGFDHDDTSIFDSQLKFLRDARIAHAAINILYATPKTPLHARLRKEGRLDEKDPPDFGTNVIPKRMTRAELQDGCLRVFKELYNPDAYFERLDNFFLNFKFPLSRLPYWRQHPLSRIKARLIFRLLFFLIRRRLMRHVTACGNITVSGFEGYGNNGES